MRVKRKQVTIMVILSSLMVLQVSISSVNSDYDKNPLSDFTLESNKDNNLELQETVKKYFSTFLGGSEKDEIRSISTDSENNIVVTGETSSTDFPIVNGYDESHNGEIDAFVTKFNASGSILWSTFLGGSGYDIGSSLAIDTQDCIILTGWTDSSDFPTLNSYDEHLGGIFDAFVTKFDASGNMIWSTYLGESGWEFGHSVATDSENNIIVTGYTNSTEFPTENGFAALNSGWEDAFVTKFDPSGDIIWSTYLGGTQNDFGNSVTIDSQDCIILTGWTGSLDFPTLNSYDENLGGHYDAFVTKFDASGNLIWSTYLGGSDWDESFSVTIDSEDNAIVVGETRSSDFPVFNGFDNTSNSNEGNYDAFVVKFDSSGNLVWSTILGGTNGAVAESVSINSQNNIVVTGYTGSTDFPIMDGFDNTHNGYKDAFITRFDASGNMIWSTYIGGSGNDRANSVTFDSEDNIIVSGQAYSSDFPISYGLNGTFKPYGGTFVAKLPSTSSDYDEDGLIDGKEIILGTNILVNDTDSDGLLDGEEVNFYKTNPLLADTDNDGFSDSDEVAAGTDPLDELDFPKEDESISDENLPIGSFLITISSFVFVVQLNRRKKLSVNHLTGSK